MKTKLFGLGALLVAVQLTWTPFAFADRLYDDVQLKERIRSDLEHLHIEDLDVEVLGWEVTLSGTAESLAQTRQAEKRAMRQPGVKEVFNDLRVVQVPDDALREAVTATIEKDRRHYTIYDLVHISVNDGAVFLSGHALDARAADAIDTTVSKVRGVAVINNDIETTPMSQSDENLQSVLVFTINRALTPYINANPSVHVMVTDGHVSLSGYVDGVEAQGAVEKAVMSTEGVLSVDNGLRSRR